MRFTDVYCDFVFIQFIEWNWIGILNGDQSGIWLDLMEYKMQALLWFILNTPENNGLVGDETTYSGPSRVCLIWSGTGSSQVILRG